MIGVDLLPTLACLGAAALVLGPKGLPQAARTAGFALGRATAYVRQAAQVADRLARENAEVGTLRGELQQSLEELSRIRGEVRRAGRGAAAGALFGGHDAETVKVAPSVAVSGTSSPSTAATAAKTSDAAARTQIPSASLAPLPVSASKLGVLPSHDRFAPRHVRPPSGGGAPSANPSGLGGARYGADILLEAEAEAEVAERVSTFLASQQPP